MLCSITQILIHILLLTIFYCQQKITEDHDHKEGFEKVLSDVQKCATPLQTRCVKSKSPELKFLVRCLPIVKKNMQHLPILGTLLNLLHN